MKYVVSISELSKKVKVHAFDCATNLNAQNMDKKENVSEHCRSFELYCKSYEEAWSWVSLGNFEEEYLYEDCSCCNPGDWSSL